MHKYADSHHHFLPDDGSSSQQPTRRRFLAQGLGLGVAAVSTCGCALFVTKRKPDLVLGPVRGTLTIPVIRFDELAGPRNAVLLQNQATGEKILLVRAASSYSALSATCTHRGCDVDYGVTSHRIVCPCHGSEFDLEGRNLKGPAARPLRHYSVRLETNRIIVDV